jgi:hypothetical protein
MRTLLAPLLAVPLLVLVPSTTAHAVGTCTGLPATIESSGGTVAGTPGDDRYTSTGDVSDQVTAGAGTDTISTGDGVDTVASGVTGEPNRDVIDLGGDPDRLTLTLPVGSDVQTTGGTDTWSDSVKVLADPGAAR